MADLKRSTVLHSEDSAWSCLRCSLCHIMKDFFGAMKAIHSAFLRQFAPHNSVPQLFNGLQFTGLREPMSVDSKQHLFPRLAFSFCYLVGTRMAESYHFLV